MAARVGVKGAAGFIFLDENDPGTYVSESAKQKKGKRQIITVFHYQIQISYKNKHKKPARVV